MGGLLREERGCRQHWAVFALKFWWRSALEGRATGRDWGKKYKRCDLGPDGHGVLDGNETGNGHSRGERKVINVKRWSWSVGCGGGGGGGKDELVRGRGREKEKMMLARTCFSVLGRGQQGREGAVWGVACADCILGPFLG